MGADWVGWITPISRFREEALSVLDAMSIEEIIKRNTEQETVIAWEIEDGTHDISDEGEEGFHLDESAIRERCRDAVNVAYDCYEGKYRLGSGASFGEAKFAIAGGASWGDTPEYVDDLCIVDALRVAYDETKTLKWVDA